MVSTKKMEAQLEAMNRSMETTAKALSEVVQQLADLKQEMSDVARRIDKVEAHLLEQERDESANTKGKGVTHDGSKENTSGPNGDPLVEPSHYKDEAFGGFRRGPNPKVFEPWKRIDLPSFNGDEAFAWVDKAERFFRMSGLPVENWVSSAFLAMEGRALTWFRWWESDDRGNDWGCFRRELLN